jgi:hypothetical protein
MKDARKPGEPIYLRRHMVGLALAVTLPLVLLQLYKIYMGPMSFGTQLTAGFIISILTGIVLYRTYRSTAQNQP